MKYLFLKEDLNCIIERCNELMEEHKEIGKSVGEATSQSSETWHDNAVFDIARDAGRMLEDRIQKLNNIISNAIIVMPPANKVNKAVIGSIVRIKYNDSNQETWFKIGSYEVPKNKFSLIDGKKIIAVSYVSPIGACLLNKQQGEHLSFSVDGGKTSRKLTLLEICNGEYVNAEEMGNA